MDQGAVPNRHEAISGPHAVTLVAPCRGEIRDGCVATELLVRAGEVRTFVLTYRRSHEAAPPDIEAADALDATESNWTDWVSRCALQGPWREQVVRSLITIKALTFRPTGGLVAAPTTSLPERIGGDRNWDYRFCWLRDASFTLQAFLRGGYRSEAAAWRDWLLHAAAGMPEALQPIYGIAGEHRIEEQDILWLPGFRRIITGQDREPGRPAVAARYFR
ncbi:glycoside hydrolase family 15 protein [Bradyrhizobium icense]|uniref:glycoside hydrolase family 15 protein n=1 Tax=Bradyrhizobium icense TaxID=1274631 RepID=UPI000B1BDA4B